MEGFEVPLAAWRVHATAAGHHQRVGNTVSAKRHRQLSAETILKLAHSLREEERLRGIFLSSPSVQQIVNPRRVLNAASYILGGPQRHLAGRNRHQRMQPRDGTEPNAPTSSHPSPTLSGWLFRQRAFC
jgi:hypothetical protein